MDLAPDGREEDGEANLILLAVIDWFLLTLCGEYVLRQASFADGWRRRRTTGRHGCWWRKMLGCFHCPFGWSGAVSAVLVAFGVLLWTVEPWAVVPPALLASPAFGLGLSRAFYWLTPVATRDRPDPRSSED